LVLHAGSHILLLSTPKYGEGHLVTQISSEFEVKLLKKAEELHLIWHSFVVLLRTSPKKQDKQLFGPGPKQLLQALLHFLHILSGSVL